MIPIQESTIRFNASAIDLRILQFVLILIVFNLTEGGRGGYCHCHKFSSHHNQKSNNVGKNNRHGRAFVAEPRNLGRNATSYCTEFLLGDNRGGGTADVALDANDNSNNASQSKSKSKSKSKSRSNNNENKNDMKKIMSSSSSSSTTTTMTIMDFSTLLTYFCNIIILTSSVVTVPAMAAERKLSAHDTATFSATVASLASLGGFFGKVINGFVCQKLGGRRSSILYMLVASAMSLSMSYYHHHIPSSPSLASSSSSSTATINTVGLYVLGFEFLSSIQWTAICNVYDQLYRDDQYQMARRIAYLSVSSTFAALATKTVGSFLLRYYSWRIICRCCSVAALIGTTSMYLGVSVNGSGSGKYEGNDRKRVTATTTTATSTFETSDRQHQQHHQQSSSSSPLTALKLILKSPIFWMIGTGHSLGYIARSSDRLLGPFLQDVGGIPGTLATGLTSSVTIGFILGLIRGNTFSKMNSIDGKMNMIKTSYVISFLSVLGLAICGGNGSSASGINSSSSNYIVVTAITVLSCIFASTVSFQFYQLPNLFSSTIFPNHSAVALSLTDAVAYLVTACILGINRHLLGQFGWCAAWTFIASMFSIGGTVVTRAVRPILVKSLQQTQKQKSRYRSEESIECQPPTINK